MIEAPSVQQLRAFLAAVDESDEEHGAAWLTTDEEYSLEWNGDGRLVLSTPDHPGSRAILGVTRERALALWSDLLAGDLSFLEREPWKEGNGYVLTPQRAAANDRAQRESARAFYESLGAERADTRCRREGCGRGAVALSVFCRPHHFESVARQACPFEDQGHS